MRAGGAVADERHRPLSPWAVIDRLERLVAQRKGARLTWETSFVVLEALRAYVANPKREELARVICMRTTTKRTPCEPLCRRCLDLGYELKCMMRGETDVFDDRGWYDGRHRVHEKGKVGKA